MLTIRPRHIRSFQLPTALPFCFLLAAVFLSSFFSSATARFALAQNIGEPEDEVGSITPAQGIIGMLDATSTGDEKPTPATDKYVLLKPRLGKAEVVKVMCEIGDRRLVKLPTGELSVVSRSSTQATDQPFKSAPRSAIIEKLKSDGFGDFKIEPAGYYLYVYDCSEAYYAHTRSILESMLSGVVNQLREWGLNPQRPETPLVVVIMPSRAAFDAFKPMPPGVAAYYNGLTNRVVLYEDQRLWEAAPEFALKQAGYTVAHEGIHQILHNTGVQQRLSSWPKWISEGLPEYFCPLKVNSRLVKQNSDELPERTLKWTEAGMVNDLRMYDLLRTPTQDGDIIQTVVSANNLTAHGYSVAWGLVHYLSTREGDAFAAYLQDVRQSKPLMPLFEQTGRSPDPLFVKHFGEDYPILETKVQRHLTSRKIQDKYKDPVVNQTYYVVKRIYKKARTFYTSAVITRSPAAAREWRDREEAKLEAAGYEGRFYTIQCDDAKEAEYQLRKLLN